MFIDSDINIVFIGGIVLLLLAIIYALLAVYSLWRRIYLSKKQANINLQILQNQLDTTLTEYRFKNDVNELSWSGFRKFRIERKIIEANDVYSFYLVPHDGHPLQPFLAGQYLTLKVKIPNQPDPVVRCYSLSDNSNQTDYYRITIKRLATPPNKPDVPEGLFSNYMHKELHENDIIDVIAPRGHFTVEPSAASPVVFIAGGIGITPFISMLNTLCSQSSKREIWFFYCVINSADHIMKKHWQDLVTHYPNLHLCILYSAPLEKDVAGKDYDFPGFLTLDRLKSVLPSNNFIFYVCGPPPMMKAINSYLLEWDVPEEAILFEAFGPASVAKIGKIKPSAQANETGFDITFSRSKRTIRWKPDDGSLLELAEKHGIKVDYGCRAGSCGMCSVALKSGYVDYPIKPVTPIEKGLCLLCIGIPKEPLEIDA